MSKFESEIKSNSLLNYLPLANSENLVIQETKDELLIYNLKSNKAACLNQTAAAVWTMCDGKNDLPEIASKLEKKFGYSIDDELIWFALDQLNKEGLLSNNGSPPNNFSRLSRREVLKKVGFASMIALPIVSSIVAPKAIRAQSCVNPGGGAAGTPGTNVTNCGGSVAACNNLCTTDPFFLAGCCNGTGQLVQPGADCNFGSGCFCQCT